MPIQSTTSHVAYLERRQTGGPHPCHMAQTPGEGPCSGSLQELQLPGPQQERCPGSGACSGDLQCRAACSGALQAAGAGSCPRTGAAEVEVQAEPAAHPC